MDRFVIRKPKPPIIEESSKRSCEEINVDDLSADPVDQRRMSNYNPNDREKVRRAYLQRGPYQPRGHKFPQKVIGKHKKRFSFVSLDLYKPWLEYSVKEDAAFCLYCYLCANDDEENDDTSFTTGGFSNWKKPERFEVHIGGINSSHNQCKRKCKDLMNQNQHIGYSFAKQSDQSRIEYETWLLASIDCVRFLLHQGLAFRGHDESDNSNNKGNFKELLKFLADHNEETRKVILQNAPGNNKLSSHQIQLDITSACAIETSKAIVEDIVGDYFSILVDECRDVSTKEQMALVIRYVNKKCYVIKRFIRIIHVTNTTYIL